MAPNVNALESPGVESSTERSPLTMRFFLLGTDGKFEPLTMIGQSIGPDGRDYFLTAVTVTTSPSLSVTCRV